jgi:general secretion pathway protein G
MKRTHNPARGAFTLIELLLVLVILAVLAAVVIPKLTGRVETARYNGTVSELSNLKSALETFEVDNSRFPTTAEGLEALVECPPDLQSQGTWNKQLDSVPLDKWGMPYQYQGPDTTGTNEFQIISSGSDKVMGTDDDLYAVK